MAEVRNPICVKCGTCCHQWKVQLDLPTAEKNGWTLAFKQHIEKDTTIMLGAVKRIDLIFHAPCLEYNYTTHLCNNYEARENICKNYLCNKHYSITKNA